MNEFSFRQGGEEISVSPSTAPRREGGAVLAVENGIYRSSVDVWAHEVPYVACKIATAMHHAAGFPAPVILDRPVIGGEPVCWYAPARSVLGVGAHAEITRRSGGIGIALSEPLDLDPDQAREFAALVAACADAAETEPDPSDVEKLTAEIRTAPGMEGIATADVIARHILRAYRLEARQ